MEKKQQSGTKTRKSGKKEGASGIGGREFGNVIEPMQAQMASGNEGLTLGTSGGEKEKHGTKTRSRKKAA